ncbi:MAG: 2TM domain-containing protein [Maribacter sp.]
MKHLNTTDMNTLPFSKYERAKLKVASLRRFYNHVMVYVILNSLLYLLRDKFTFVLLSKNALGNPDVLEWINWNVYGTTIVWGGILGIHAIKVFGNFNVLLNDWEQRQIEKYVQEEVKESEKF